MANDGFQRQSRFWDPSASMTGNSSSDRLDAVYERTRKALLGDKPVILIVDEMSGANTQAVQAALASMMNTSRIMDEKGNTVRISPEFPFSVEDMLKAAALDKKLGPGKPKP